MSSRRRTTQCTSEDQIKECLFKLQTLLPESSSRCTTRIPASKVLQETCNYIHSLRGELDDLSERLAHLLASMDTSDTELNFAQKISTNIDFSP